MRTAHNPMAPVIELAEAIKRRRLETLERGSMAEQGERAGRAGCEHDWVDVCRYAPPRCLAAWCTMPGCGAHVVCSCRVLRPKRKAAGSDAVSAGETEGTPVGVGPEPDTGSPCWAAPSDASDADELSSADLVAWEECRFSQRAHDGWD